MDVSYIYCITPISIGEQVILQYTRRLETREVKMVAEREAQELVYIAELYLTPDYSQVAIEPMAPWFLQLLSSPGTRFNVLASAIEELQFKVGFSDI